MSIPLTEGLADAIPMPFPVSERVVYAKNPLVFVGCELRFPTILKIRTQPPAELQEHVRSDLPWFEAKQLGPTFPAEIPPQLAAQIVASTPGISTVGHEFSSEDRTWQLLITDSSFAFSTQAYPRWEEFKTKLRDAFGAFVNVYQPQFFNYVGLRYHNVIRRSSLGLADTPWSNLLRRELIGELADSNISGEVHSANKRVGIRLESGIADVHHYLATDNDTKETVYVVNANYFSSDKTGTKDVFTVLDSYHSMSGKFFRWCIREELHAAMEPSIE